MTRGGVRRALRSELRRLRSWPAVWAVIGAWLILAFLFAYVFPYIAFRTGSADLAGSGAGRGILGMEMSPRRAPAVAIQAMPLFGGAMTMVLGVLVTGSGYSWDTWKTAATQTVARQALIMGSLLAATCLCAVLVVIVMTAGLGTSLLIAATEGLDARVPSPGIWVTAAATGFGVLEMGLLLGCALGVVFRATGLPLGLALIWTLVVENLLRGVGLLLPGLLHVTDLLPGTAAGSLVGAVNGRALGEVTPGILTDVGGARALVTVVLYATASAVTASLVFTRRDLT